MPQDTYVALPNGSYVQIPRSATPEQLSAFRERLRSYSEVSGMTEAAERAKMGAPDPVAQAQTAVRKPLDELREKAFSIFTPTGDVPPEQVEATRKAQRTVTETVGAMAGGEAVEPLVGEARDLLSARWLLPKAMRAAGAGTGAATGAAVSGANPKEAAKTGAQYAGGELGGEALLGSLGAAYRKIFSDPKLTMQQASQMLAEAISKEDLSPRQFGQSLQEGFDEISNAAGAEKREFISRVSQQFPDLTVRSRNLANALQTEVNNLNTMKARNPELFVQGEAMDRTLKILDRELRNLTDTNLGAADLRRSQFWNYKQQLDPSYASRVVGTLDKAATNDITEGLASRNPGAAKEYLQKSARYHELSDLGRMNTLKDVFGNERVAPGKVVQVLTQSPEDALMAIRVMNKSNPQAVQNLRRAVFEQSIKTSGVNSLFKQQPSLIREIYGPQADAVSQFVDIVNKKSGGTSVVSKLPGKAGTAARLFVSDGRSGQIIPLSEMNKILQSAQMVRLFTQAAEMPVNSGPARMMRETLDRAMLAVGVKPEEAAPRKPVWGGNE